MRGWYGGKLSYSPRQKHVWVWVLSLMGLEQLCEKSSWSVDGECGTLNIQCVIVVSALLLIVIKGGGHWMLGFKNTDLILS